MSTDLIDPQKHHQLFLDSRALVSEQGTTRTLHPPQKCGPLITGGIQSRSAPLWNPDEGRYVHRRPAPPTRPARAPKRRPLPSSAKIRRRQPKRHPQRQPRRRVRLSNALAHRRQQATLANRAPRPALCAQKRRPTCACLIMNSPRQSAYTDKRRTKSVRPNVISTFGSRGEGLFLARRSNQVDIRMPSYWTCGRSFLKESENLSWHEPRIRYFDSSPSR